jgi:Cu(I)/Ag(I) efflux system membrane fusion protein
MKIKNMMLAVLLVAMLPGIAMAMGNLQKSETVKKTHDVYTCPMHPNYTSDHPGQCPYCGMDLVKRGTQ